MMHRLICLFALIFAVATPMNAQNANAIDPSFIDLQILAEPDPQTALAQADAALAGIQSQGNPDPRRIYSLVQVKIDLLLALDRKSEAAVLISALAGHVKANRDVLLIDPISLHRQAALIFEELGDLRSALQQVNAILEEQRDGGRSGEILVATLTELADLSEKLNRNSDAERYRASAELALEPVSEGVRGEGSGFREVEVYYATDRAQSGQPDPSEFYGYERGELELGIAVVTIPDSHQPGVVETPSVWRLEFGASPAKHVVLKSVTPVAADEFFGKLNHKLSTTENREAFVFIHGYNVRFEMATRRAAQIAYDMQFPGVPVLYSWPSRGSTIGYLADAAVVRLSGRRLALFLEDLVEKSGATTIHIVAHSMGNRALTDALEIMALRRNQTEESEPIFGQILFAAPDVDAGLFIEMIKTIRPIATRLTLYASEQDWALESSRKLHGNALRAGQGGGGTLVDTNIDSIDMSELGDDMLAHSYFSDDSSALADMMTLFWQNTAPQRRCGLVTDNAAPDTPPVWKYELSKCASKNLIDLLAQLKSERVTTQSEARTILSRTVESPELASELEPVIIKILGN